MKTDASFGIIPLKFYEGEWQVLLIRHNAGHWAFPKGHPNPGETHRETAERELREETSLTIEEWLSETSLSEHYHFKFNGQLIDKTVTYFLAKVTGHLVLLEEEVSDGLWVPVKEAGQHVTFAEAKALCEKVNRILKERES